MLARKRTPEQPETLAQRLAREGALPLCDVIDLVDVLVDQVDFLHATARVHRAITADSIDLDEKKQPHLRPTKGLVQFGGPRANSFTAPPELQLHHRVFLPEEFGAAQKILRDAGTHLDPRRIDVYCLGVLMAQMLTNVPVDRYLRSLQVASALPAPVRNVIDGALGFHTSTRLGLCSELKKAIRKLRTGEPDSMPISAIVADDQRHPKLPQEATPAFEPAPSDLPPPTAPRAFERLGHFRIDQLIGAGGMGEVFKGFDETLGRPVAIKVLPAELARHDEYVRRFHTEASAAAKLAHPNVVPIYSIGQDGPYHFFAMQFVEGESLSQRLRRDGRLCIKDALRLFEECLHGLNAAHSQGLIHRDIKPGNILLDASTGRAMLADFGLVTHVDQTSRLTASGMIMGTVDYIAPEQARGQRVDTRSDLYSLGVLLYQLLSGRLPFKADTPTAMLFQHAYEPPFPLLQAAPEVPEPLAAIVARLMAKKPEDRYQTCERVLADINAFRDKKPISVPHPLDASSEIYADPDLPNQTSALPAWFQVIKNRLVKLMDSYLPVRVDELRSTEQRVDDAIAEYKRRRDTLGKLIEEAVSVGQGLAEQADSYRRAADLAGRRVDAATSDVERYDAEQNRQQQVLAVKEIKAHVARHDDQLAEMRLQFAQINARLVDLSSQRDVLIARMKVVQARHNTPRHSLRQRQRMTVVSMSMLLVLLLTAVLVFRLRDGRTPVTQGAKRAIPNNVVGTNPAKPIGSLPVTSPPLLNSQMVYLTDLREASIEYWEYSRGFGFGKNGRYKTVDVPHPYADIALGGKKSPHGIFAHPKPNGRSNIKYEIGHLRAKTFEATCGVDDDRKYRPLTPLIFEVLGDKKSLWRSIPIKEWGKPYVCQIDISGVSVLELRVNCAGPGDFAYSVWCEPRLIGANNEAAVTAQVSPPPPISSPSQSVSPTPPPSNQAGTTTNSVGMILKFIPPGEFMMGSSEADITAAEKAASHSSRFAEFQLSLTHEQPQHRVRINRLFLMGMYEVTQHEYEVVMGNNPSFFASTGDGKGRVRNENTDRFPVENVSWNDAVAFCQKLSQLEGKTYRLPTEAEWEYACRAGTATPFYFGDVLNRNRANANGFNPYGTTAMWKGEGRPTHVGSYTANGFGLFDMHGNVWEWCQDVRDDNAYKNRSGITINPLVTSGGAARIMRGGSWDFNTFDCRSAYRDGQPPESRANRFGFRVVREWP